MKQPASEGQRVSRRGFMVQAGSAGLALGVAPESSYAQSGGKGAMKITGIQTYKFSVPTGQEIRDPSTGELISSTAKPWLFLKITTNSGIVGWGEGSGEWLVPSVEATLHEWKPLLIGQDPLGVVRLTEDIQNRLPWKGGATFGTAIAAINIALYDIAGKAWGVPIHTILGGRNATRSGSTPGAPCSTAPRRPWPRPRRWPRPALPGSRGIPWRPASGPWTRPPWPTAWPAWRPCAAPWAPASTSFWTPTEAPPRSSASTTPAGWPPTSRSSWKNPSRWAPSMPCWRSPGTVPCPLPPERSSSP